MPEGHPCRSPRNEQSQQDHRCQTMYPMSDAPVAATMAAVPLPITMRSYDLVTPRNRLMGLGERELQCPVGGVDPMSLLPTERRKRSVSSDAR